MKRPPSRCTTTPTRSSATAQKQRVSCPQESGGLALQSTPPPSLWLHLCVWSNPKPATNVLVRKAHFKMNRAFKVIQGHPYWCRQESRTVCCRNLQLMPTLYLKLTKIWQRENGKFVDFNDPTQVWRRPSKKRLRISTNDLYCQKLHRGPQKKVPLLFLR